MTYKQQDVPTLPGMIPLTANLALTSRGTTTLLRPWFDNVSQTEHHILAIQEPGYKKHTKRTYCPSGFALLHEGIPTTKVCLIVSKALNPATWRYKIHGPHIGALYLFDLGDLILDTTIINVYNPSSDTPTIRAWPAIELAIQNAKGEVLLLGDFNTHRSAWEGIGTAKEPQADRLHRDAALSGRYTHLDHLSFFSLDPPLLLSQLSRAASLAIMALTPLISLSPS